jgi:hypothetical protein
MSVVLLPRAGVAAGVAAVLAVLAALVVVVVIEVSAVVVLAVVVADDGGCCSAQASSAAGSAAAAAATGTVRMVGADGEEEAILGFAGDMSRPGRGGVGRGVGRTFGVDGVLGVGVGVCLVDLGGAVVLTGGFGACLTTTTTGWGELLAATALVAGGLREAVLSMPVWGVVRARGGRYHGGGGLPESCRCWGGRRMFDGGGGGGGGGCRGAAAASSQPGRGRVSSSRSRTKGSTTTTTCGCPRGG